MEDDKVKIRLMKESDIQGILNYWYRSPHVFLEGMGVDLSRLPTEKDMEASLRRNLRGDAEKVTLLIIERGGKAIGAHVLNQFDGTKSAVFHAHIWDPGHRRQGIATQSYPLAIRDFFRMHGLEKIVFKTPAQNTGALKVKERLGLKQVGQEISQYGLLQTGTVLCVYEITPLQLES